jgi:hypothetical protein
MENFGHIEWLPRLPGDAVCGIGTCEAMEIFNRFRNRLRTDKNLGDFLPLSASQDLHGIPSLLCNASAFPGIVPTFALLLGAASANSSSLPLRRSDSRPKSASLVLWASAIAMFS